MWLLNDFSFGRLDAVLDDHMAAKAESGHECEPVPAAI
jgi:hypothetical protein